MQCRDCGATYYSAGAATLVQRGERCPSCGGELERAGVADGAPVGAESCDYAVRRLEEPSDRRFGRSGS